MGVSKTAPGQEYGAKSEVARVVLIDDHELVRYALGRLISAQGDLEVVGQASSAGEARAILRDTKPDVVVLDLLLPEMSGKEFALELLEQDPTLSLLIVSGRVEPTEIQFLVEAGVKGYVSKTAPADEFVRAVRSIAQGQHYFSSEAASALAGAMRRNQGEPMNPLSLRQMLVLQHMARGRTTKEIAEDMCLSPKTVEKYRSEILRRLNCKNQVQAIEAARKRNLLDE